MTLSELIFTVDTVRADDTRGSIVSWMGSVNFSRGNFFTTALRCRSSLSQSLALQLGLLKNTTKILAAVLKISREKCIKIKFLAFLEASRKKVQK
jgi:hypothetical protein